MCEVFGVYCFSLLKSWLAFEFAVLLKYVYFIDWRERERERERGRGRVRGREGGREM